MNQDNYLDYVNDMYAEMKHEPVEDRKKFAEDIINESLKVTGEIPSPSVLSRLGDLILYDYVEGDTRSNKMRVEEYPIMSDAQYRRRTKGDGQDLYTRDYSYVEAPIEDASIMASSDEELDLSILDTLD